MVSKFDVPFTHLVTQASPPLVRFFRAAFHLGSFVHRIRRTMLNLFNFCVCLLATGNSKKRSLWSVNKATEVECGLYSKSAKRERRVSPTSYCIAKFWTISFFLKEIDNIFTSFPTITVNRFERYL